MPFDTVTKLRHGASFLEHLADNLTPNDNTTAMKAQAAVLSEIAGDFDNHTPNEVAAAFEEKGRLVKIAQEDPEYDTYYEGWMDGMNAADREIRD